MGDLEVSQAIKRLADSVTPLAAPFQDGNFRVGCLTESVIYHRDGLIQIAYAIERLADAIETLGKKS